MVKKADCLWLKTSSFVFKLTTVRCQQFLVHSNSKKECSQGTIKKEQFTIPGHNTLTVSYNSVRWKNKMTLGVLWTQSNLNLIHTELWAGCSFSGTNLAKEVIIQYKNDRKKLIKENCELWKQEHGLKVTLKGNTRWMKWCLRVRISL